MFLTSSSGNGELQREKEVGEVSIMIAIILAVLF